MPSNIHTEVVRGSAAGSRREQVLTLWAAHGVLDGDVARQRLDELVCVLVDGTDTVVGVSSPYQDQVPHVGGRRFWVHRRFLAPGLADEADATLLNDTFTVLERESAGSDEAPVGLCVLVDDAASVARHPEAVWSDTGMYYAGYLADGTQVRIRYFDGARIV